MILDRVTITGADDSVSPTDLGAITDEFPFVEWGILFSGSKQGSSPRYPTRKWLEDLGALASQRTLRLSAHLCGSWVREMVLDGQPTFQKEYQNLWPIWQRLQLNFHGQYHKASGEFLAALRQGKEKDWIFQHDGVNDDLILGFMNNPTIRAFPLFDRSGGAGVVPKTWPKPIWSYQGYAGGLGPENLPHELERIKEVVGPERIWIDMETKVRSDDDKEFVLSKVRHCLEISKRFMDSPK